MRKFQFLKLALLVLCAAVAAACTSGTAAPPPAVEEPQPETAVAPAVEDQAHQKGGFEIASGEIQLVEFTAVW